MNKAFWLVAALWPLGATAQIELVPDADPPAVFASRPQNIHVALRNAGDTTVTSDVQTLLFQLTSATAVPIGNARPWKRLQILPRQTVLETLALEFPAVRSSSHFRVELLGIGSMEATVYPNDLLTRLNSLAGEQPLGVYDPDGQLKPLLKQAAVSVADFETEPTDSKLAIVWSSAAVLPESIASRVKKGMSAVWIRSSTIPTTYAVHQGAGVVVVAPASTLRGLADSPVPQLNLIRDAELALEPDALRLPSDNRTE
ncbi:MAG: hypothetical protein ACLP0A_12700 [Verrucomicrobiia bacterium]